MFPASWSFPGVQQLFDTISTNSTQPDPTPQPVPDSPTKASVSHLNRGQIAGIAIGVTIAILVVTVSWYMVNRRRRIHATVDPVENTSEVKTSGPGIATTLDKYNTRDYKTELPGSAWIHQGSLRNDFSASEIRGDLGGTEVHGDSGAFELSGDDRVVRT